MNVRLAFIDVNSLLLETASSGLELTLKRMIMSVVYEAHIVSWSIMYCLDVASHDRCGILGRKKFRKYIKSIGK